MYLFFRACQLQLWPYQEGMGQQTNKIQKQNRRKNYLKRKKLAAKTAAPATKAEKAKK